MSKLAEQTRPNIPLEVQVRVFFRDDWLCHWCHRPTVFAPALKYLERFIKDQGYQRPIAYFDLHWRRDAAPLLDHLGATIDHIEPFSTGGAHHEDNFVTACNKCNIRKNDRAATTFLEERPSELVKGRYGEPKHWDGLVSLFLVLAGQYKADLTIRERRWYKTLTEYLSSQLVLNNDAPDLIDA